MVQFISYDGNNLEVTDIGECGGRELICFSIDDNGDKLMATNITKEQAIQLIKHLQEQVGR